MRSSNHLVALAVAAILPVLSTSSVRAQVFTRPSRPFSLYLNIPVETLSGLWDNSDDQDSNSYYDPTDAEQSIGYSLKYDLFRTVGRRRPMLFSAYYDNFTICDTFNTSYGQPNGVTNTYPGAEHLRAQGVGFEVRFYVAGHDPATGLDQSSGIFVSAAEGYYRVTGSRNAIGLSEAPISQSGTETVLAPKFSIGYEGLGFANLQLSYCLFNNLGISNFNQNQPLVIQVGARF